MITTNVQTEDLFAMLNTLYTAFDELVDRHGVHKVDTIGDGTRAQRQQSFSEQMMILPLDKTLHPATARVFSNGGLVGAGSNI